MLLIWPAQAAALYAFLFTGVVDVASTVNGVLPSGISVESGGNGVAGKLPGRGRDCCWRRSTRRCTWDCRWLAGAVAGRGGHILFLWAALLYTTAFTNLSGLFSGVWQGMGYWVAQQDYGRANQPWYYYFAGLPAV